MRQLLIFLFLSFTLNGLSQKLCGESIAVLPVECATPQTTKVNEQVSRFLGDYLANSSDCDYVSRKYLGEIITFQKSEKTIDNVFHHLNEEVKDNLFIADITFLAIIQTNSITLGKRPGYRTEILFYSTCRGVSNVSMNLEFTVSEGVNISIMSELISDELEPNFVCNNEDIRLAALKRSYIQEEQKFNASLFEQFDLCDELPEFIYELRKAKKGKKKRYRSYFEKQKANCEKLKSLLVNVEKKELELQIAILEYNSGKKEQEEEFTSKGGNGNVKSPVKVNVPPTLVPQKEEFGVRKTRSCLGNKYFTMTNDVEFSKKFKGKFFVQFATLPPSNFNSCDFNIFFNDGAKSIYLVDKGTHLSLKARMRSLIGPYDSKSEAVSMLNKVRRRKYYKDAELFLVKRK